MYILMIARGLPTSKHPMWGCFEKDQAEALASFGHKVIVVSIDSRFLLEFRKIGVTHTIVNNIHYYNYFLIPGTFSDIISHSLCTKIKEWQMEKLFKRILIEHGKPDIIYGQFFFNTLLGVRISQKYRIPLVGIEHAGRFNEPTLNNWKSTQQDAKYAYTHADAAIAVSETLKQSLTRHFSINPVVVHNMVSKEFTYTPAAPHPFTFVATGRLVYGKGFDLLPVAFSKIKDSLPDDWQMLIVGGGKERTNLQRQINLSGLQDHIRLLGQKTKAEIIPLLQSSDVFILPSRGENFSVAVLEALACGLPVIASVTGGIRECINAHNGLLFPVNDVDALANALKTIYINRTAYDRPAIAADCQARFSPQVIARQLTDIFQQVLSARATN